MGIRSHTKTKLRNQPFWLPARSFYLIVLSIAAIGFLFIVAVLGEQDGDQGIVEALFVFVVIMMAGIITREIVFRFYREKHSIDRRRLDANLRSPMGSFHGSDATKKFTLEMNVTALENIRKKSQAANVLSRSADGHMEVFELCDVYRRTIANELPNIHPDSPRLSPLIRGNFEAAKLQKFHLLRWAELESRSYANNARNAANADKRTEYTIRARQTIQFALERFPEIRELQESADLFDELLAQIEEEQADDLPRPNSRSDEEQTVPVG